MKYGVVVFKNTKNIGDDIQSYAAMQFLPQVDYLVERETLDLFHPDHDETVSVIMNGWYMYNKYNWPVSDFINPLYISMHFWQNAHFLDYHIGDEFLEGIGSEGLVEHGPVGCRDNATLELLQKKGIPCYYSACLTLTLPKQFSKTDVKKYICVTDVDDSVVNYLKSCCGTDMEIRILHHEEMVSENSSWDERIKNVESLLSLYQNAVCVFTTRLHCALPCLALNTPVLLLNDKLGEEERFTGLYDLLHITQTEKLISGEYAYNIQNPPKNKDKYLLYRGKLIEKCEQFITDSKKVLSNDPKRRERFNKNWEQRARFKQELLAGRYRSINQNVEDMLKYEESLRAWIHNLQNEISDLKYRKELLTHDIAEKDRQIEKNRDEIKITLNKCGLLQYQNAEYISEIAENKMKIKDLESEIDSKKKYVEKYGDLEDELAKVKLEMKTLKVENEELIFKNESLKCDLEAFRNSQWYRLTKPGRMVTLFIRRLFKI